MKISVKLVLISISVLVCVAMFLLMQVSQKASSTVMTLLEEEFKASSRYKAISEMRLDLSQLVLAAMDSIIDQADRKISDERMLIIQGAIDRLNANLGLLRSHAKSQEEHERLDLLKKSIHDLGVAVAVDLDKEIRIGLTESSKAAIDDAIDGSGEILDENLKKMQEDAFAVMMAKTTLVSDMGKATNWKLQFGFLLSLAIILPLLILMTISINRSLAKLANGLQEMSMGNYEVELASSHIFAEIDRMLSSAHIFKETGLEKIQLENDNLEQAKQFEIERKESIRKIVDSFKAKVQVIIGTLAASSSQLSLTAEQMNDIIKQSTDLVQVADSCANSTSDSVSDANEAAYEMVENANTAASQINKTISIVGTSVNLVNQADNHAKSLMEASQQVKGVIRIIAEISSNINLLALNATIEASRAGDAGKGFAVVANEVKNLANQTNESIKEIERTVQKINDASGSIVMALSEINASVNDISQASNYVSDAIYQQSEISKRISQSMASATHGTQTIAKNLDQVNMHSTMSSSSSAQVFSSAKELSEEAKQLNEAVESFMQEMLV